MSSIFEQALADSPLEETQEDEIEVVAVDKSDEIVSPRERKKKKPRKVAVHDPTGSLAIVNMSGKRPYLSYWSSPQWETILRACADLETEGNVTHFIDDWMRQHPLVHEVSKKLRE